MPLHPLEDRPGLFTDPETQEMVSIRSHIQEPVLADFEIRGLTNSTDSGSVVLLGFRRKGVGEETDPEDFKEPPAVEENQDG